jgi:hypothetical protein
MTKRKVILTLLSLSIVVLEITFVLTNGFKSPIQRIETKLATTIPVNASSVGAQYGSGVLRMGPSFFLELTLPTQDAQEFMMQICDDEPFGTQYNGRAFDRISHWPDWFLPNPDTISISAYCVVEDTAASLDVFVDTHDLQTYIVYIRGIGGG